MQSRENVDYLYLGFTLLNMPEIKNMNLILNFPWLVWWTNV